MVGKHGIRVINNSKKEYFSQKPCRWHFQENITKFIKERHQESQTDQRRSCLRQSYNFTESSDHQGQCYKYGCPGWEWAPTTDNWGSYCTGGLNCIKCKNIDSSLQAQEYTNNWLCQLQFLRNTIVAKVVTFPTQIQSWPVHKFTRCHWPALHWSIITWILIYYSIVYCIFTFQW